jgi:hypothetical protein
MLVRKSNWLKRKGALIDLLVYFAFFMVSRVCYLDFLNSFLILQSNRNKFT